MEGLIDSRAINYIDPDDAIPRCMSKTERFWITLAIKRWNAWQFIYQET